MSLTEDVETDYLVLRLAVELELIVNLAWCGGPPLVCVLSIKSLIKSSAASALQ